MQEGEAGVERFVAAFVDGPRGELGGIGDFLEGQQVAQALEHVGGAQALHAFEDDDQVRKTGSKLGVFNNLKETLAADSEEKVAVADFVVVFKG